MAKKIEHLDFQILDINMGCPVPKIVGNGEGSALMKNPELVRAILTSLVKNSKKPVTVKIRKGFDDDCINADRIAYIAQESGAAAVCVHGRTREQFYAGQADWDIIAKVKAAVSIPVIGNGDVVDGKSAEAMMLQTGCDGVAIGRAVRGNPFLFREIIHYLETGEHLPKADRKERLETVIRHAKLQLEYKGEYIGVREMRKHLGWYSAGIPGAAKYRGKVNEMETMDDIIAVARQMFG